MSLPSNHCSFFKYLTYDCVLLVYIIIMAMSMTIEKLLNELF